MTIQQILDGDSGDSSLLHNLAKRGREMEQENASLRARLEMAEHCLAEIRALMPSEWRGLEITMCVLRLRALATQSQSALSGPLTTNPPCSPSSEQS